MKPLKFQAMKKIIFTFVIALCGLCICHVSGQNVKDTSGLYKISTIDGNDYIGHILYRDSSSVSLSTAKLGKINISTADIRSMEAIGAGQVRNGKIWQKNTQDVRYFFAPSGYGLEKGEAYYQNVWVWYNQFHVGISKNVSIGFGTVPLFLFNGAPTPIWVIPKVSVPVVKDKFNIGAGALVGYVVGVEKAGFGIAFGTATFGSRDKNVSFGIGYGYVNGDFAKKPIINLSALIRISPRAYFITENYYIPINDEGLFLISLGGRTIIKRVGLDYGLFIPAYSDIDFFVAVPWLGVTAALGKTKAR
jgi:hypothetical protein